MVQFAGLFLSGIVRIFTFCFGIVRERFFPQMQAEYEARKANREESILGHNSSHIGLWRRMHRHAKQGQAAMRDFFGTGSTEASVAGSRGAKYAVGDEDAGPSAEGVRAPPRCFGLGGLAGRRLRNGGGSPAGHASLRKRTGSRMRQLGDIAELPHAVTERSERIQTLLEAVNMEAAALQAALIETAADGSLIGASRHGGAGASVRRPSRGGGETLSPAALRRLPSPKIVLEAHPLSEKRFNKGVFSPAAGAAGPSGAADTTSLASHLRDLPSPPQTPSGGGPATPNGSLLAPDASRSGGGPLGAVLLSASSRNRLLVKESEKRKADAAGGVAADGGAAAATGRTLGSDGV